MCRRGVVVGGRGCIPCVQFLSEALWLLTSLVTCRKCSRAKPTGPLLTIQPTSHHIPRANTSQQSAAHKVQPWVTPGLPSEDWKGVASTHVPVSAPALAPMDSISIPMVMREGKAWGLMMRSGRMPVEDAYGMSTSGHLGTWQARQGVGCQTRPHRH